MMFWYKEINKSFGAPSAPVLKLRPYRASLKTIAHCYQNAAPGGANCKTLFHLKTWFDKFGVNGFVFNSDAGV